MINKGNNNNKRGSTVESKSPFDFGKIPPQAIDLEEIVLGALLLEKEAILQVANILSPDMFYVDANKEVARSIWMLYHENKPIDMVIVAEHLKQRGLLQRVGGYYYIAQLTKRIVSSANIEYHSRIIIQKWILRELISISTNIVKESYNDSSDPFDLLDEVQNNVFTVLDKLNMGKDQTMDKILIKAIKEIESAKDQETGLTGIPSGFTGIDRVTNGWQKTDLIIIAGRPGMGKSAQVLQMARNIVVNFKKSVAVFSMEMGDVQLVKRLISSESEVAMNKILNGNIQNHEWNMINNKVGPLSTPNLIIDDTANWDIISLSAKCKKLVHVDGVEVIIIDYLQLMHGSNRKKNMNREQEVSEIARGLKKMAKELNVPMIALSQLSRAVETRSDKRPQLSDLRESGCLTGDTLILNQKTGERVPIKQLAENKEYKKHTVTGLCNDYKLRNKPISNAFCTGEKQVYELTTRTGRKIKATANHKFRRIDGWFRLDNLSVGDRIAVPKEYWDTIRKYKDKTNLSWRLFSSLINTKFCGTTLFKRSIGRDRLKRIYDNVLPVEEIKNLSESDVYWDPIVAINKIGIERVYDLTIPDIHNFVANDIIVHNSIEQDADVVAFLYRPEYYGIEEDEEGNSTKGVAEFIIAKHRNGSLDNVKIKFLPQFVKFIDEPPLGDDYTFQSAPEAELNKLPTSVMRQQDHSIDDDVPF